MITPDLIKDIIAIIGSAASLGAIALLAVMLVTHGVRRTISTLRHLVDIAVGRKVAEESISYVEINEKLKDKVAALSEKNVNLVNELDRYRVECHRMQRTIEALYQKVEAHKVEQQRIASIIQSIERQANDIEGVTENLERIIECIICKGGTCGGECPIWSGHRPDSSVAER